MNKIVHPFEKSKGAQMPYRITLRSRTNASITAWYDGSRSRWSTDHTRQKLFDKKRDAKPVCHELRRLCPRNAKVINIEPLLYRSEVLDQIGWRVRANSSGQVC